MMTSENERDRIITMTVGEYKDSLSESYDKGGQFAMNEVKEVYPDIVNTEMYQEWFWVDDYEVES
jgi:hypothetical protein